MIFNSYTFIGFFVIVLLVSRAISSWPQRKFFLLLVSYVFYAAWNPPFVVLLWISTVVDWFTANRIHQASTDHRRKIWLVVSLLMNLGLLSYFKYGTFILDNFVYLVNQAGIPYSPANPSIILPVGISFYTFQTLSYTLDVYKKVMAPWHSFLDYALYVTFFPQLVAGPIVRATDFLPQCETPKQGNAQQIAWGMSLFVIGLFNKVVIADTFMAPIAERVYDSVDIPGFFAAWAGTLAFAIQIFCDFSGYSTCAIGIAICLGFVLPPNFRYPYGAVGFSDFWRRWHITLSTWLRDYLYIPLGGNRRGEVRTLYNLMMTMLIGGLWHGASWLFVIWGGLHGLYLVGERFVKAQKFARWSIWRNSFVQSLLALLTFGLVCFAWVFFRAKNLDRAYQITSAMFGSSSLTMASAPGIPELLLPRTDYLTVLVVTAAILFTHALLRNRSFEELTTRIPWWMYSTFLALLICAIFISFQGEDRAFIYFQF
ncbi:MAG: MBOAT family protein [Caldilineaceae bacterium]|nr:MBOAT family protein [Caldilineaceae bacterium]